MEKKKPELFFSTLTGIILSFFFLANLTDRELFRFHFNFFNFSISMALNTIELVIPSAAAATVVGLYYAFRSWLQINRRQMILSLFLPFAVTLTIGFTLRNLSYGLNSWGLLLISGVLLYLVLLFEFISCDPDSPHKARAIIVLNSLCYAVFLLFAIALRANVSRLIVSIPAIFFLCFGISMKIYSFYIINSSIIIAASVTSFVLCCADAGLHYWPVNIISYGALIFLWYYIFSNFIIGADREEESKSIIRRILPAGISSVFVLIYSMIRL